MIKSVFTPTPVISSQEDSSTWYLLGSPAYTRQDSVAQIMKLINASYQALNYSDSSLASNCRICMKPGPIQYTEVILNQSFI
jgi:hypothetical protein